MAKDFLYDAEPDRPGGTDREADLLQDAPRGRLVNSAEGSRTVRAGRWDKSTCFLFSCNLSRATLD